MAAWTGMAPIGPPEVDRFRELRHGRPPKAEGSPFSRTSSRPPKPTMPPNQAPRSGQARLIAHPTTPAAMVSSVAASCSIVDRRGINLKFRIEADMARLSIPARATSRRGADLWRTSCGEAFIRPRGGTLYWEINISPSSEWSVYRFASYRSGRSDEANVADVEIEVARFERRLEIEASLVTPFLHEVLEESRATEFDVGLSTVIEDESGVLSYWALAHPPGKPDFHQPSCFIYRP